MDPEQTANVIRGSDSEDPYLGVSGQSARICSRSVRYKQGSSDPEPAPTNPRVAELGEQAPQQRARAMLQVDTIDEGARQDSMPVADDVGDVEA